MRHNNPWLESERDVIRQYWPTGVSAKYIGGKLGRSEAAVNSEVVRMRTTGKREPALAFRNPEARRR